MVPGVLLVLAAGLVTGALIGAVGVGGVLIAPLLVLLAGFDVHEAVAVASFSFIFTGVVGALSYSGRGNVNWRAATWVAVGVVPAALIGALVNSWVPGTVLTVLICILVGASGVR